MMVLKAETMRIMGMVVMMVEDAADEIRGWDDNDGGDDNDEDGGDDDHDVPTYKGDGADRVMQLRSNIAHHAGSIISTL